MSGTETIQTQYGDVEIETVDCDSCGQTIAKEDANDFTLGHRDGYACDHCVDNGPISFPPTVDVILEPSEDYFFAVAFWPILFAFGTMDVLSGKTHDRGKEWHTGAVGTFLWIVLPLCLLIYFGVI